MKLIIFLMSNFFLCIHFTPVNAQNPLNVKIIGIGNISRSEMKMISEGITDYYSFTFTWQKEIGYKIDTAYLDEDIILTKPFLDSLEENHPCDSDKILFVTNEKITISRIPFYDLRHLIRGYASAVGGNFAIVSTYRLKIEANSKAEYNQLLIKTARHEFGHMVGLEHCSDKTCLMKSGGDPVVFRNLNYRICDLCKGKLK